MGKRSNRSGTKADAVFIGWQETTWGTRLALFNVTAEDHSSHGSTVCEPTLRELHLQVPRIHLREREVNEFVPQKNEREMRKE
jgi:hypothetical protein